MIGAAISGAIGLASSIYGGIKSAQANKEAEKNINQQEASAEAFFNNQVNQDFMQTNAAKGVVEELRKRYQEQAKQIDSKTAATGGTAEANIAAKTESNDQYNDVMNNVAQGATSYQQHGQDVYQNQLSDIARQRMALTQQEGQSAGNLMAGGAETLGSAADVLALNDRDTGGVGAGSLPGISGENRPTLDYIAKSKSSVKPNLFGNKDSDYDFLRNKII
jgi:hypothetical protein